MASFVKKQAHKPWFWSAMDAKTRQVLALQGDHSRKSAKRWWAKMPEAWRQHATFSQISQTCHRELVHHSPHGPSTRE
jgi:IS1 family transposase